MVQLPAADWENYQSEIQAVTTQLGTAITTITPLLQNATPPPDADETDFTAAVTALQSAGDALAALGQAPTPTPAPGT